MQHEEVFPVTSLTACLLLSCALAGQTATERPLPFSDKAWQLRGERTTVAKDGDREVLQVESGTARWLDAQFEDGAIDFDVQLTSRRSFVYVEFRGVADGEYEEMYLRPHKANLPDAVQYAPVWQGRSGWQLYHGPGATAAVPFEHGAWTHVRVIVQGRRAALFVKDMEKPALIVPHLARDPKPGFIGLRGFLPADVPGAGPIARFANVVVRPGAVPFDFAAALANAASPSPETSAQSVTAVRSWAVSQSFVPQGNEVSALPAAGVTGEFRKIDAEPNGLLELHRHVPVPPKSRVTAGVARVAIRANAAGNYVFDLGFSDIATVFLNGRPVFRGDATYTFDRPRREGLIGYDQARLYLPLAAGNNDLSIVVSDVFGGWGIMGRFVGAQGLTIEAR
jgi:hypothetical protein